MGIMPTLAEQRIASKLKAEQAIARLKRVEARIAKHTRRQTNRLYFILGEGAVTGNLADQCLLHVSDEKRAAAEMLRKELASIQEDTTRDLTDKPQGQTDA